MSVPEEDIEVDPALRKRTYHPGMLLMWAGIFNVIGGLVQIHLGIQVRRLPAEEVRTQIQEGPQILEKLGLYRKEYADQLGEISAEDFKTMRLYYLFILGGVNLITALITAYGGYNLLTLNSYRLAVAGAILVAIPIISTLGCLLMGQVVGGWALVVLLNREVRSAFP